MMVLEETPFYALLPYTLGSMDFLTCSKSVSLVLEDKPFQWFPLIEMVLERCSFVPFPPFCISSSLLWMWWSCKAILLCLFTCLLQPITLSGVMVLEGSSFLPSTCLLLLFGFEWIWWSWKAVLLCLPTLST